MPDAPAAVRADETFEQLLARCAGEWLTFGRLRQELLNQGAPDPMTVSPRRRDVESTVALMLKPGRDPHERERIIVALVRSLLEHPDLARKRLAVQAKLPAGANVRLQSMLRANDDMFARWGEFQDGMSRIGPAICQIRVDGQAAGSGFLIGDQHVLTAFHVVKDLIDENRQQTKDSHKKLAVVFDDLVIPGQRSDAYRVTFEVARKWLADCSPFDPAEDESDTPLLVIGDDLLDFVVIALEQPAGKMAPKYQKSTVRSWIDLDQLAGVPQPDTQMVIAHHPGGADLRLCVGLYSDHAQGNRRIRYLAPTVLGSSGAPCFDVSWKPYALHNAGYEVANVNQGVPLELIWEAIRKSGSMPNRRVASRKRLPAVSPEGSPILGREDIAEQVIRSMRGESGVTTIVITGAKGTGKKYTGELIRAIVVDRGHSAFFLNAEKFAADTAEAFAKRIVDETVGASDEAQPSSPDTRQRARWITRRLASWALSSISSHPAGKAPAGGSRKTLWLILDCGSVFFTQETHDLLVALLGDDEAESSHPLRIVLLGYEGDLASLPPERIWRTRLELLSVAGALPFMQHTLESLEVNEDAEILRANTATWVDATADAGVTTIPKFVNALERWAANRHAKWAAARA